MKKSKLASLTLKQKSLAAISVATLAVNNAQAAVPTEASDAITTYATDAGTFIGSGWSIAVVSVLGLALIGLFKKIVNKAT